ncbi:hypothetical protein D9758_007938 [Tetrapyrgos nigripes]|uniref:F-box domain-containing protein n=1 Tax=Tetrapyrgos nigripes TaxID=182062 RepID=A0A8H5D3G2_9AGAR|nr:hypothetical protein D9758_007938 [Tetrapyrgos nigripes]
MKIDDKKLIRFEDEVRHGNFTKVAPNLAPTLFAAMSLLLDLPTELLSYILSYASFKDVLAFQSVSRLFNDIISNSTELRYQILLQASGMIDNARSSIPLGIRYEMLKEREKSWFLLQPRFTQHIPVRHPSVVIYELSELAYMLSEIPRKTVDYIILPSDPEDPVPDWRKLSIDEICTHEADPSQQLLDFGVAMRDHDLLVVVTTVDSLNSFTTLRISWVQLSTGKRHPLSGPSISFVQDAPFECIGVGIEIVGDLTALVLRDARPDHSDRDRVMILDWKKGMIKAELKPQHRRYQNAIFLSQDVLLVPNAHKGSIELWRIPLFNQPHNDVHSHTQPLELNTPDLTLYLPLVSSGFTVQDFACRSAPSPSSSSTANCSDTYYERPFQSDPEQSIIVFHLSIALINARMPIPIVFLAHRKAFLELLRLREDSEKVVAEGEDLGYSERKRNLETQAHAMESDDNDPGHDNISSSPLSSSLPWSSWGPSQTRFFGQGQLFHTEWITTTSGQRYALLQNYHGVHADLGRGRGQPVGVLDFNDSMVKRVKKALERVEEASFSMEFHKRGEMRRQPRYEGLMSMVGHVRKDEHESVSPSASTDDADSDIASDSDLDPDSCSFDIPLLDISIPVVGWGNAVSGFQNSRNIKILSPGQLPLPPQLNTQPYSSPHAQPASHPHPQYHRVPHQIHSSSTIIGPGSSQFQLVEGSSDSASLKKIFAEPVGGSLPYVMICSEMDYGFHGVVMDDERILGVRRSSFLGGVDSVEVLWFG